MTVHGQDSFFAAHNWFRPGRGPRYLQLCSHIGDAIASGRLGPETLLPSERALAELAGVSRVTVRKALARLVRDGLVRQRRGAGSFVRGPGPRLEHSLSTLTSFTEYMQRRGKASSSLILNAGLFMPTPDETMSLGLSPSERVARIERLRSADGQPMAIECSSVPEELLPAPDTVTTSLYSVLRNSGHTPVRAVQRIGACNLAAREAELLNLPEGSAVLKIERAGYLANGRPVEFTRGTYRSDIYDFVAELRPDATT